MRRSETDAIDLVSEGIRIRLCKGAYKEPPEIAFQAKSEVDAILSGLGIDGTVRAERLGVESFRALASALKGVFSDPAALEATRAGGLDVDIEDADTREDI